MRLDTRAAGFTFACIAVLAVGPDAALLRAQQQAGGTITVISTWRYILLSFANLAAALIFEGSPAKLLRGVQRSPLELLGASFIVVFINIGFTISLLKVNAAKALLLISLNPLWAALMGRLLLNDVLRTRTVISQILSIISTLLVFVPTFSSMLGAMVLGADADDDDDAEAAADAAAAVAAASEGVSATVDWVDIVPLLTGIAVAGLLTYSRWQARASLEMAPCLGALLTAVGAAPFMLVVGGEPISRLFSGLRPPFWFALVGSAVGSAVYDSACVIAPRSLTSAETALILLGETVFGPLWVWVAYGDMPDVWTLAGGGLLLFTLVGHEVAGMIEEAAQTPYQAPAAAPKEQQLPPVFALHAAEAGGVPRTYSGDTSLMRLNFGVGARSPILGERFREGIASSVASSLDRSPIPSVGSGLASIGSDLDSKAVPLLDKQQQAEHQPSPLGSERASSGPIRLRAQSG